MNIEKQLTIYKEYMDVQPKEENIKKTIEASKEVFLSAEQKMTLSYCAFLYAQYKLIQKKWWLFQSLILVGLWIILPLENNSLYFYRSMGVVASLFVILIIPELWKNRTYHSIEIEASAYYSLHQIYAARMLLFGVVDVLIITVFCGITCISLRITLTDLLVQFLFPMVVTACICFGVLCSKRFYSELIGICMCMIWSILWWVILLDERIYTTITIPVWILLLGIALLLLAFTIYKSIHCCNKFWEVNLNETGNE